MVLIEFASLSFLDHCRNLHRSVSKTNETLSLVGTQKKGNKAYFEDERDFENQICRELKFLNDFSFF